MVERLVSRTVFGAVLPVFCLLVGWWGSVAVVKDDALIAAIAGLSSVMGLALTMIIFEKWVPDVYSLDYRITMLVYIFYSVFTFVVFMGVPVFNIVPGLLLGIYVGRRLNYSSAGDSESRYIVRRAVVFSTVIYSLFCLVAAALTLSAPYTAGNLQGALGIESFPVARTMIWGLVIGGGTITVFMHYWAVKKTTCLFAGCTS